MKQISGCKWAIVTPCGRLAKVGSSLRRATFGREKDARKRWEEFKDREGFRLVKLFFEEVEEMNNNPNKQATTLKASYYKGEMK